MFTLRPGRLTHEMLIRIVADAVLISIGTLAALAVHYLYLVAFGQPLPGDDYRGLLWSYLSAFARTGWLLTLVCLVIFYTGGFYTHGRAYRSRYKAVLVTQAASLGFLVYGFVSFFVTGRLPIPRGAWALAWAFSTLLLVSARVWARVWATVAQSERGTLPVTEDRKIRKVLVIGGAGYIGSALLPKLLDRGYRVRVLDLLLYGTKPIENVLHHPRLELVQCDFRRIDRVVDAMRDVDAVIHLGAIVGDPACSLNEELTTEVNLIATRMIAEVAKGSGVGRFIFASTCSVYGASDELLDEHSALRPVSLYARSKIASEKVLLQMADSRFVPSIVRFATIFGLSGRTRFDLVVNLLTAKAVVDGQITITNGDQWRPFIHVDDAAQALLMILEARLPLVKNQIFNVGSDDLNYTIREVGELIQRLVPTATIIDGGNDGDRRNYRVNFGKIRRTLHFMPRWTLEQGVRQVVDALARGEVEDYRAAMYSNFKFLKEEGLSHLIRPENGWAYDLLKDASEEFQSTPPRPSTPGLTRGNPDA